jgi:hypothetical protein
VSIPSDVTLDDSLSSDPEATMDPLDGEKDAGDQVKPSEPSRLDARPSSSVDDSHVLAFF